MTAPGEPEPNGASGMVRYAGADRSGVGVAAPGARDDSEVGTYPEEPGELGGSNGIRSVIIRAAVTASGLSAGSGAAAR